MKDRAFFNWLIILLGVVAIIGFCFTPALAEMDDPMLTIQSEDDSMLEEPGPDFEILDDNFGQGAQYTWIPIDDFTMWRYTDTYTEVGNYRYFINGSYNYLGSGINLPSGAFLYGARVYFYDNDAGTVHAYIWRNTLPNTSTLLKTASSSGTPGYGSLWLDLNHTIRNGDGYYVVYVAASTASPNLRVGSVRLYWKRQISPAPGTATFNDVGTGHWAFRSVEALAASGITQGCPDGPNLYCPDKPVSRAAMAAFLARALGLHWGYPY